MVKPKATIQSSPELTAVLSHVVGGADYATEISRLQKKNFSGVSEQLGQLEKMGLVFRGTKDEAMHFAPNWNNILTETHRLFCVKYSLDEDKCEQARLFWYDDAVLKLFQHVCGQAAKREIGRRTMGFFEAFLSPMELYMTYASFLSPGMFAIIQKESEGAREEIVLFSRCAPKLAQLDRLRGGTPESEQIKTMLRFALQQGKDAENTKKKGRPVPSLKNVFL